MKLHAKTGLGPSRRTPAEAIGARAIGTSVSGPTAISALAIGATAIGALAIGRLAIGKLTAGRVHFERLRVDELEVGSLRIEDPDPGTGLGPAGIAASPRVAPGSKLGHVDLVVSSLEKSLAFYRGLLGPLGWNDLDEIEGERGEKVTYVSVAGSGVAAIGLREKQSDAHPAPYDRYALGVHHVCIDVPSRDAVDERAAWVEAQGAGEVLSPPATHEYTPGYYATFLADPDGIKLELLYRPTYWGESADGIGSAP